MPKAEMQGALFFSKEHPQITGYLVIAGVEYEIAGWIATSIRAEVKARRRDNAPVQLDMIDGASDEHGETGP